MFRGISVIKQVQRLLVGIAVLSRIVFAQTPDSDPVTALATILAQKGTITSAELQQIKNTSETQRKLAQLASILKTKGVLTNDELASLSLRAAPSPLPAPPNPAPQSVVAQKLPAPQSPTAKIPVPEVKSQTHVPITLYGTLLLNTFYNTAPTNIQDVPLFLSKQGSDPNGGDKNYGMTARQSRLGLKYEDPSFAGAKLSGNFEFDLFGGKTPFPNGIDMDIFRLRLAYGRMDWQHVAFEAGQDWSVFAPLNPTSYASYAIPEFASAGNPWIRLPQIRVELKNNLGATNKILWQTAALDPNMGDYQTTVFSAARTPGIGERGRMPNIESRLALTRTIHDRDFTVAVSGHYNRGINSGLFDNAILHQTVNSWGVALDYTLPVTHLFSLTGEAYVGRALGIYSVTNGESIGLVGTAGGRGVESRGGWMQGQFNFTGQWQMNLAYGIDDPNVSELPVGNRGRNQSYMGNIMFRWKPYMIFSWEYRRLLTDYRNQLFADERGDHADMGIAYTF